MEMRVWKEGRSADGSVKRCLDRHCRCGRVHVEWYVQHPCKNIELPIIIEVEVAACPCCDDCDWARSLPWEVEERLGKTLVDSL